MKPFGVDKSRTGEKHVGNLPFTLGQALETGSNTGYDALAHPMCVESSGGEG